MSIFARWSMIAGVLFLLSACGGEDKKTATDTSNPGTNSTDNSGNKETKSDVRGTIHLFTSICDAHTHSCPADKAPYGANITIEMQRPNGWQLLGTVDTQDLGEVLITVVPGTYRLKQADAASGSTNEASVDAAIVTITGTEMVTVSLDFLKN